MNKKLIVSLSLLLPNLSFGAPQESSFLVVEPTANNENAIVEEIVANYPNIFKIESIKKSKIILETAENEEVIATIISELKASLGDSVKIEHTTSSDIKKGTQDGEFGK